MQFKGMQKSQIQNITHRFKTGTIVKIVEVGKSSDTSYTIIKLKKSIDGTPLYLLKSDSSPIMLLFYESKGSHLEKIQ
ncbi:MAG TPA: hypothetical protein VD689_04025 [Nitrosopumilaceae archaeon]|nr:hypothetical protein [Nitrosopumilaceae archaeon]